ncbi:MAG: hypothetical protein JRE81_17285 [Deltaproteobacteria bacterium]|jgi:hypothetical protein|nr:hypothetical protein [Deltaproteobacteria bacterium]
MTGIWGMERVVREERRQWIWARCVLSVAQLGSLCWIVMLTSFEHGFPLDDAWIHQVVGRTFAETGVLGYTPDRFASAATSLLWAAVVAMNHAWFELEPAVFAFTINAALLMATGQVWLTMLERDGASVGVALGCTLLGTTASNFVWFAASGMESTLLVFLSTLVVWLWTERGRHPSRRAWCAGIALGLLFFTRPEAVALLGVLALVFPWTGRTWRDFLRMATPCFVAVLAYAAAMWRATGHARPSTLEGRHVMWFQDLPAASRLELVQRMLTFWGDRLAEHTLALSSSRLLFWLFLGLALGGAYVVLRHQWLRFGGVVLWGFAHLAIYAMLLPTPGHGGRYQPLTPALFMGLAWVGAWALASSLRARAPSLLRREVIAAFALAMAIPTGRSLSACSRAHRDAVMHIWDTEVAMGRVVSALPEEALVASFDIGGIGYFAGRELVDLGALVDASIVGALRESSVWPELSSRGVQYVVVPEGFGHGFPDPWNFYWRLGFHKASSFRLAPLERLASTERSWKSGVEASLHGAPVQVLYRVEEAR